MQLVEDKVRTSRKPLVCNLCGETFDCDNEDELIIKVRPARLETSKKSGRVRFVELDFNLKVNGLDGYDYLLWHLRCIVDELQDPSVIGYVY